MNLFTSDIDWAPEAVIEDTIALFNKYNVKCTFFCTHQSDVLNSIKSDKNFELGIHPNFNPLLQGNSSNQTEILENILKIYPDAKGVRSHSLTYNGYLQIAFKNHGLLYESNTFLPYWNNIHPYKTWNNLTIVPFNFEDDIHFLSEKNFNSVDLNLFENKLNVFDFHPIHIFLNTDCIETYNNAKLHYQNANELIKHRNTKTTGARDLLIKLLENHHKYFNTSYTLYNYLKLENFIH